MNPDSPNTQIQDTQTRTHNNHNHNQDPYAFLFDVAHMSSSQQQHLQQAPFVGGATPSSDTDISSPLSGDVPVASDGIIMVSLPDSQDAAKDAAVPNDVFHTPPEGSSLHSSDVDVDVDVCAVNHAVDPDAGTQGFVHYSDAPESLDLGKDSQLGFSEVQAKCSDDIIDAVGQIGDCRGVESQKAEVAMEICMQKHVTDHDGGGVNSDQVECVVERCKRKLVSENDGGFNPEKVACTVEVSKSSGGGGVEEGSGMQNKSDEGLRVLPSSVSGRVENAVSEVGSESSREKINVFDVLKALSEMSDDEDGVDLSKVSLLDVARASGLIVPRPRWYPKELDYPPK